MAAHRLGSTVPNTPLLNPHTNSYRYQHYAPASANTNRDEEARLPTGRCNFTNLSVGGNAPRCGCRRFWDKALGTGTQSQGRSGFCMCEHHACYHDDVPGGYTSTPTPTSRTSNPNAISNDAVMSSGSSTVENTPLRQQQLQAQMHEREEREELDRRHDSTIPDTAQWGRYVHSGPGSNASLPAIPSQCLLPSETGSMTSGCGSSYLKPFGGLGLRSLSHIPTPSAAAKAQTQNSAPAQKQSERPMQIYEDANGNGYLQSLTEVATPSARTSQDPAEDLGQNIASMKEALNGYADGRAQTEIALRPVSKGESVHIKQSASGPRIESLVAHDPNEENLLPRIKHIMGQFIDFPNKIHDHEHRLEQLENVSFSNAQIDELRDDYERVDTRMGDLEEKFNDLDRQMSAINDGSVCGRQHLSSFDSRASVTSSAMVASAIDRVDPARVEALEAQVAELQASALPSHSRPWEVEIVFLPFGSRLMGIWSSQHGMSQRSRLSSTITDDWTQTQNYLAEAQALSARDHAFSWERSATDIAAEEHNAWLMARACGMGSRADERLRSRGLVKLVQVHGTEARDVQAAMAKAFGDLPDTIAKDPYTFHDENAGSVPKSHKAYLGLSNPWIPLRKVHKNSCLRFLNPCEMVTAALWTVAFLSSSVAMRHKKVRRLYVTHRDSYIQRVGHGTTDWTWQKLRQLPRVYPDRPSFSHTPEADAHEPCWEFDERLDPPEESIHSSFASQISSLSIRSGHAHSPPPEVEQDIEPASPSDHFSSAARSRNASTTPTSVAPTAPPLTPLKERKERDPFRARPVHGRTTSMPTLVPTKSPHLGNKRRITSFDHEHEHEHESYAQAHPHSSPSCAPSTSAQAQALMLKRRRTRSPSKDVAAVGGGPRWSVGPPSPYTFVDELGGINVRESKGKERERDRAMTPFAYATPHSNAPYIERDREGSGAPISVYEDESAAGNENFGGEGEEGNGDGSVTDEIDVDLDAHFNNQRREFEAGMGMGTGFSNDFANYDDDGAEEEEDDHFNQEQDFGDEGSIDLDQSLSLGQERQLDEEWEGVQDLDEESHGVTIGGVVEAEIFDDEDEDDRGSENSSGGSVPSEYPSKQHKQLEANFGDGVGSGIFEDGAEELGPGFRIHIDEDDDDDDGDDELV
ncbi:hypothetical protein EG329_007725 [Mollisiaceae sp. DMI_Dod_QoI]|nr:hypothetical protein EG329_007725 [Helotiales sp. DMI_Dod_QoI]